MTAGARRFRGIRMQVTLICIAVIFAAMAAVVGLSAYASMSSVKEVIDRSLAERLDDAEAAVAIGDYERATDTTGSELLQVIGRNGEIIASSANAHGLAAIAGSEDSDEVEDVPLEKDSTSGQPESDNGYLLPATAIDNVDEDGDIAEIDDDDADGDDDDYTGAYYGADAGDNIDDDDFDSYAAAPDSDADDDDDDAGDRDDSDADDRDDADDADDDDADDDDARATPKAVRSAHPGAAKAGARTHMFDMLSPEAAYADEPQENRSSSEATSAPATHGAKMDSIMASDVLGSPGPFLIMRRQTKSPDGDVTLVAMTSLAPALDVARQTAWQIGAILAALLVLAAFFVWYMTGRTLRPVEQMRLEVDAISPSDLDKRVTAPDGDPELTRLAVTFNGLLARVQAALTAQKQFVSDASHELKSPVAATGLMLETLRSCPDQIRDRQVLDDLSAENDRMGRIVGDLLTLARQDEGRSNVHKRLTDICDILYEEADSLRRRTAIAVDDSDIMPVVGSTDPDMLSHALRNLLDNAARYAENRVCISCCKKEDEIEIRISDDGPGIPPEDRERVFDRFVRLEGDRSRKQGSTGLGLAVTRGIIEQLGGTVHFVDPGSEGATALILLPAE